VKRRRVREFPAATGTNRAAVHEPGSQKPTREKHLRRGDVDIEIGVAERAHLEAESGDQRPRYRTATGADERGETRTWADRQGWFFKSLRGNGMRITVAAASGGVLARNARIVEKRTGNSVKL
jgi:hypothetical protein